MKITRSFCPGDRYKYDFKLCTSAKGWAQIDTSQDASYFGAWANPSRFEVFTYCEGDTTLEQCESAPEFVAKIHEMRDWYNAQTERGFRGIDPGFNESLKQAFIDIGLGALLH